MLNSEEGFFVQARWEVGHFAHISVIVYLVDSEDLLVARGKLNYWANPHYAESLCEWHHWWLHIGFTF